MNEDNVYEDLPPELKNYLIYEFERGFRFGVARCTRITTKVAESRKTKHDKDLLIRVRNDFNKLRLD